MTTFTCRGPKRGDCGETHDTPAEAVAHVVADHEARGATDRYVFGDDGSVWGLHRNGGPAQLADEDAQEAKDALK